MATLLLTALACVALAAPPQDVASLRLDGAPRIDGLYVASDGRLYGAGTYTGSEVYRIDGDGDVVTLAAGLRGPTHLGMDAAGNLYVSEFNGAAIARIAPDGTVTRHAEVAPGPAGVVVDPDGTVYVSHYGTGNGTERRISRIAPDGTVSTLSQDGLLAAPIGLAQDDAGYLYAANFFDGRIVRVAPDGSQKLVATVTLPNGNPSPIGHLAYASGALWATGGRANRIYRVSLDGEVETWAGDGSSEDRDGPRGQARFLHPNGIAAASDGRTVYVATAGNGAGNRSVIRTLDVAGQEGSAVAQEEERWHYVFPHANTRPTYRSMHALEEAQARASGRGVRVGILDHGFGMDDYPELYADGVDLLGNGALTRYAEHGYWMALTLREIAPAAEIIALNTASREPMESARAIVQAIDWAIDNDIDVLSYSHAPFSDEAREIIDPAIDRAVAAGILPVFIHYPHPDNVFPTGMWPLEEQGIGSADINVLHYDYKLFILDNYERALERGDLRQVFLSVSSTAPVVAGVAAMIIELAPDLGPRQLEEILVATSHEVEFEGRQAPRTLDAGAAVARAAQSGVVVVGRVSGPGARPPD